MDFFIQAGSPVPPYAQIRDQIRLGLALGYLLPGERLPSLRDLEEKLGISRDLVRKAYLELADLGILELVHGKGVVVNHALPTPKGKTLVPKCEDLAKQVEDSCKAIGINVYSFATFLQHKALANDQKAPSVLYVDMTQELATERALDLCNLLRVNVVGYSTDQLGTIAATIGTETRILSNYYRLTEIKKILTTSDAKPIPLRMRYDAALLRGLRKLRAGSEVTLLVSEVDKLEMELVLADYKKLFSQQRLKFSLQSIASGVEAIRFNTRATFIVSNRIWNDLPKEVQVLPHVTRNAIEFDPSSIEEVKLELGIVA